MPRLNLIVKGTPIVQHRGTLEEVAFHDGSLTLNPPLQNPVLKRVLNRRLWCYLRFPPTNGAIDALLDTGAPLSIFPLDVWQHRYNWQEGIHYDICHIGGLGAKVQAQVLHYNYTCRIVRLKIPIEAAGTEIGGTRLRLDGLIAQLAESNDVKFAMLGLWGGFFESRQLEINRANNSDELQASLNW